MKRVLKISEYDSALVNDSGTDAFTLSTGDIEKIEKVNEQIKKRDHLSQDIVWFKYRAEKAYEISTSSYVGVLKVNNRIIQIIPKLAKTNNDSPTYNKEAISNLLYMLSYTKRLKISETSVASLTRINDNFFEILIYLFAKNLLFVIQNDLYKQYISKEENLPFIKGKLVVSHHLLTNIASRHKFYMQYDDFSEDNLLNRILKYTITFLIRTTQSYSNLKMLQQLDTAFADVPLEVIHGTSFHKLVFTRLNQKYEPIIELAKLFIQNSSMKLNVHNLDTFSFLFDMNVHFEEFIGEFIRKELGGLYDNVTLQKPIRYLVDEKIKNSQSSFNFFQLRPDIQLFAKEFKNPYLIVDTKYKILDTNDSSHEGVSQGDLYQMYAYSKKFGCKDIILLYPKLQDHVISNVTFILDNDTNVFIRTVDLGKDLKIYKEELRSELIRILNPGNSFLN